MKLKRTFFVTALVLGSLPAAFAAQDFSADVIYRPSGKPEAGANGAELPSHAPSKLYVSKDKLRLETRGSLGTILLVNGDEQTTYALFPAKKEYQPIEGGLSEYFRVKDAENACSDWQNATAQKIDCKKVGHELVDGRQTVKYRNTGASDAAISAVWIDVGLKFVVKWEAAATGVELRHVQQGEQAADLFTVPADFEGPKPRKGTSKGFSNR